MRTLTIAGLAAAALLAAGCGTAAPAPARPSQCGPLLGQLKAFDGTFTAEGKADNPLAQVATSDAFQLRLRRDAGSPAVPQALWTAETGLAAGLQSFSAMGVNTALYQIAAVCGRQ